VDPAQKERGERRLYPGDAPFPDERLCMLDEIELWVRDGGPKGLGYVRGRKTVHPSNWFFAAHFQGDPVVPGSLGLESFLQLLKVAATDRWGAEPSVEFQTNALGAEHAWTYRGQVIPTDHEVRVEATIDSIVDSSRTIQASGYLSVDGRIIYGIEGFTLTHGVG
jgi:3-hydroxymyristoyl/3-hydroxydecanoyl-(acyl carrier protein) dehydratase